mgnify:CR=1 FL=1
MSTEVKQLHDESELIRLLKSRDKMGMSMLYDNYSHALFAVINQVLDNQELS